MVLVDLCGDRSSAMENIITHTKLDWLRPSANKHDIETIKRFYVYPKISR
jgi:hypothetical protein